MKFTIRDLFWLMAVVALALGWWVDHREQREAHRLMRNDAIEIREKYYDLRNSLAPATNQAKK